MNTMSFRVLKSETRFIADSGEGKTNFGEFCRYKRIEIGVCSFLFCACFPILRGSIELTDRWSTHVVMFCKFRFVKQLAILRKTPSDVDATPMHFLHAAFFSFFGSFVFCLAIRFVFSLPQYQQTFFDVLVCGKLVHVFRAGFCCLDMTNRIKE